ncbi:MAG: fibronectin type III domain-containing protein [Bacteroidales bacterium]|nr:fibronectin type III domain-containing protein [Bacteroidales bacterium]
MQKHLQKLLLIVAMMVVPWVTQGQDVQDYAFTTGVDSTMWITMSSSATHVTAIEGEDDAASSCINIGFPFNFGGTTYTQFSCNSNGRVRLGSTVCSYYWSPVFTQLTDASANDLPVVAALSMDNTLEASGSYVKYELVGTAPNRILVIEYHTPSEYDEEADQVYYQVQLLEDSSKVRFVYGTTAATYYDSYQAGLAASATDYLTVNTNTHAILNSTSATYSNWPGVYRYYEFTPVIPECPRPGLPSFDSINATSVTFQFEELGSATEWVVSLNGVEQTVYDTLVTLTGLAPNTLYTLGIASLCSGDTSNWRTTTFRTACGALTLFPYFQDFESVPTGGSTSTTFVECWHRLNNGTTYFGYPYVSSSSSYNHTPGGTKGLYWYGGTTTGTYGDYYYIVLPPVDTTVALMTTMRVNFWAKVSGSSYNPTFHVGVMTDPTDVSTFQLVGSHNINASSSTSWNNFTTEFDNFTGSGNYIAIRALRPTSYWYVYMDDITLDQIPDCPEVSNITASNITTESVDLNWTETGSATSWTLEYGEHGFTRGLGTEVTATSLPYTLYGLTANTVYDVYISPSCSDVPGVSLFSFRTECSAMDSLPYTMSFETSDGVTTTGSSTTDVFVNCWHRLNNGSDYFGYPYVASSTTYAHTGSRGLYWYNTTTTGTYGDYQVVVLPSVDTDIYQLADLRVSFWARSSSTSYNPTFQVGVMTDPTNNSSFHLVSTVPVGNSSVWAKYIVSFANYSGYGNHVAIRAVRPSSSWYAYVDDITLEVAPDCPEVDHMTASNITTSSANINWRENGSASSWTIEYGVHGFTPGTGTIESVSSRPYNISGLVANTEYDVYVTPDCSGTTLSSSFSFRTECTPTSTIPITMGFESSDGVTSTGSSTNSSFVECWHRLNNATQYFGYPYVGGSTYAHTGSRGLYWYNTTTSGTYGDYMIVVLPSVDTSNYSINRLQLKFWARPSSSSYNPTFQVGVMTDPNDATTFQAVGTVNVGNDITYREFVTGLGTYTGNGTYVAIRTLRSTTSWYAYMDDITLETMPSCPAITSIEAECTTPGAAMISWTYMEGTDDAPTAFEIQYDSIGGSSPTTVTVTDPFYMFTSLTEGTTYKAYVRAICGTDNGGMDSITFSTGVLSCLELDPTTADTIELAGGTTTTYYLPIGNYYNYSYTQQLVTAAEMNNTAATITGIDFQYAGSSASTVKNNVTIYLANTTTSSLSSAFVPYSSSFVPVYTGHMNCTTGWNHFEFTTPFSYDGSSNLLIVIHDNSGSYNGTAYTFYAHSATGKGRYVQNDGSAYNITSVSGGSSVSYRVNMRIYSGDCQTMATCDDPEIRVTRIDTAEIDLAWIPGYQETSWDLDYRPTSSSTWTSLGTSLTTNTYTVYGLTPGNSYEFRVSHMCDTTEYAGTVTAVTQCVPYAVPFTENFESWPTGQNVGTVNYCWHKGTSYSYDYPYVSSSYPHSGSKSMYMYNYTYSNWGYFALPQMATSIDSLIVSFWLYCSSSSYPNNKVQVGVMTDPENYNTFTPLGDFVPEYGAGWVQYDLMLNNYTGPDGHIAFVSPVMGSTASYSYIYLDDIVVDYIPPCPHVSNVHVRYAVADSLCLEWTPGGEETEWEVFDGTNYYTVTDDSILFTGLTANTYYTFTIRAVCSSDDTSAAVTFRTHAACGVLDSLPYTQDFEMERPGSYTSFDFVPCWYLNTDATSYPYVYVSLSSSYNHTPGGQKGIYWYRSSTSGGSYGNYQAIVLPEVDTLLYPANNLMLTFWAKPSSSSYYPVVQVGLMSDPTDGSTFYAVDTININTGGSIDWQRYNVRFDNLPDSIHGSFVAIRANYMGNYWYLYVDDITLDQIPDCSPVEDIEVAAGPVSATVTWTPVGSNYNGALVEYKESSSTTWNSVSVSGVNYASITGLTPATEYDVRVSAECDASYAYPVSSVFSTRPFDCVVYDSSNLININMTSGTSTSNYIPSYSFYNYGYSQQFFTAHEIGASGLISKVAVFPTAVSQQRTYEIYMGYSSDSSATGFITPSHLTCVYNDGHIPMVANQWLEFELTTPFNYVTDSGNLVLIFRDLTGSYVSGNAFRTHPAWSGAAHYVYQDGGSYTPGSVSGGTSLSERNDVRIFGGTCLQSSTCAAPPTVVTEVTPFTVDIAWTPGNTESAWNLYYRRTSDASFTTAALGVSTTNYQFTGLLGGTHYEFMVVPVCSDSLPTVVSATTECAAITSLPYFEDFNNWGSGTGVLPSCWFRTGTYSTYTYISTSYNRSGSTGGSIYMYQGSSNSYRSALVLPALDTSIYQVNQTQVVFYAMYNSTSYVAPAFEVGVMTDPYDAYSFVPVDTVQHHGNLNDWEIFEVPLTNYTDTGVYIAIKSLYTTNYTYFYLDDVTLEVTPTCPRPDSLASANATTNSVDLSWHERGEASQWIVEYGPVGFVLGTGTQVVANSNPFTLTGLPNSYQGEYYVKSVCGAGDTGEFSRTRCPFNTVQIPATIPYNYDFENAAEWANWQTSSNVSTNWYRGSAVADSGSYSMYVSVDSGATYRPYYSNSVVNAAAYRDIDFGTVDSSFTISFRARVGGTFSANYDGVMVFLVDPSIPTTPSSSNITSPWGNVNDLYRIATARRDTNWTTYTASFDTIHGIHRVAFFWFNQNTESGYPNYGEPVAVDNIHIDYSSCPRPVNLAATPGPTTAQLTWQGRAGASYEIAYRPYPDGTTNSYVYSNTNSVTLTGLDIVTQYAFWVRKICSAGDSSLWSDGETFTTELCDNANYIVNYDSTMSSSTSSYSPIGYATYNYSYVQTIIDSAYMAGLDGDVTAFSFFPTNTTANTYYTNMTVYMANVPESNLSSGFIMPDTTNHVFVKLLDSVSLNFDDAVEQTHLFDTTFTWDGHSNVLFAVNREHGSWTSSTSFAAHTGSGSKMRYVYNDGSAYNIHTVSGGYTSSTVGDIKLISCGSVSCAQPIITNVSHDYQSATVTWTGNGNSYEVNIKETLAPDFTNADIPVTGTTYTFTGLQPSTEYTIRVRQDCNADSMGYSEWVLTSVLTDSLPCFSPDSLTITDMTNTSATFDWQPRGNETMWDVHVWNTAGFDSIYTVSSHPVILGGYTAGVTYNASVRPLCGNANNVFGDWGDTVTFTAATCPDVTGLTATEVHANSLTLTWTNNPAATDGWVIEYGFTGFEQGTGTQAVSTTPTYVVTGLLEETGYDFYVRAVCGTDWYSENWAYVTATTPYGGTICDAPTGVSAVVAGNAATVSWTAGAGDISFELEYGPHGFAHGTGMTQTATASPVTVSNLNYETQYDVYVRAFCENNASSQWSVVTSFTTEAQGSEDCDPVTNLTAFGSGAPGHVQEEGRCYGQGAGVLRSWK